MKRRDFLKGLAAIGIIPSVEFLETPILAAESVLDEFRKIDNDIIVLRNLRSLGSGIHDYSTFEPTSLGNRVLVPAHKVSRAEITKEFDADCVDLQEVCAAGKVRRFRVFMENGEHCEFDGFIVEYNRDIPMTADQYYHEPITERIEIEMVDGTVDYYTQ